MSYKDTIIFEFRHEEGYTYRLDLRGSRRQDYTGTFILPYTPKTWTAVLHKLDPAVTLTAEEYSLLQSLGNISDLPEIAGKALGNALFASEEPRTGFHIALNQSESKRRPLPVLIHFGKNCDLLASLPWELIYYCGRFLVADSSIALSRCPASIMPATPALARLPLRVLIVLSEPKKVSPIMPERAREQLIQGLHSLREEAAVIVDILTPPTYEALIHAVRNKEYHLLVFYGHGSHDEVKGGQLLFEDPNGEIDWVSAKNLGRALHPTSVRLVLLSACQSAQVEKSGLEKSTAPVLLQTGIPLVIGMQVSLYVAAAQIFIRQFTLSLAAGKSVNEAVADARTPLVQERYGQQWYVPALYGRPMDVDRLFDPNTRSVRSMVYPHQGEEILNESAVYALTEYQRNLIKRYQYINIFGQTEPVSLEGIFTHVRTLDTPTELTRYDLGAIEKAISDAIAVDPNLLREVLREMGVNDSEIIDGLELVQRPENKRLLVLGKPGAGKTTFLRYLTLQAAKNQISKVPILVALRDWEKVDDIPSLLAFLAYELDVCGFPDSTRTIKYLLSSTDETLILFDGLDEIPRSNGRRDRAIATLQEFSHKYPRAQIIITCRVAATEYFFQGFKYVEIANFNEQQMYSFVHKWFKIDSNTAEQFWQEFCKEENKGLKELGQVPLLLTMLCLAYDATLSFPRRRVELYEEALDALLKKWDSSRRVRRDEIYHKLTLGRKRQMFARLAAEMFEAGKYFLRQRELEQRIVNYLKKLPSLGSTSSYEEIDGDSILKTIESQHGILVERAHRIHAFAHLTFQEYYTAKYVIDNAHRGTLKTLIHEHVTDDRWHEVIILTASLLDEAYTFFAHFLNVLESVIAGDCMLLNLFAQINSQANHLLPQYKPAAVRAYCFCVLLVKILNRNGIPDAYRSVVYHTRDNALTLARILDPQLNKALNDELNNIFDVTSSLAHTLDRDLNYFLRRAVDLVQEISIVNREERVKEIVQDLKQSLSSAMNIAEDVNLVTLTRALSKIEVPPADAEKSTWLILANNLRDILAQYSNFGYRWSFKEGQLYTLEQYFYTANLLAECLEVAYVTDRETIEDHLLKPPESVP